MAIPPSPSHAGSPSGLRHHAATLPLTALRAPLGLARRRPCDAAPRIAARRKLRRRLQEALLTTLATSLLTSLALADPAVLRDAPATTWQRAFGPAVAAPLIDCP